MLQVILFAVEGGEITYKRDSQRRTGCTAMNGIRLETIRVVRARRYAHLLLRAVSQVLWWARALQLVVEGPMDRGSSVVQGSAMAWACA